MHKQITIKVDPFLYRKVQIVAESKKLSLDDAAIFLLQKVITPTGNKASFRPQR